MKFKKMTLCLAALATLAAASSSMADKLQVNSNLQGDIYVTCAPGVTMFKDALLGKAVDWDVVGTVFLQLNSDSTCTFYLGDSTADELATATVHVDYHNNQGQIGAITPVPGHTIDGPTTTGGITSVTILS
jgi:hypothetical protein